MNDSRPVREIGVDNQAIHIAHHEQGRVLQRLAVLEQLVVGGIEVFMFALVFPAEEAPFPHIGPAFAAALLGDSLLECVPFAGWVHVSRTRMLEQLTQFQEMLVRRRALGKLNLAPFLDELADAHTSGPQTTEIRCIPERRFLDQIS